MWKYWKLLTIDYTSKQLKFERQRSEAYLSVHLPVSGSGEVFAENVPAESAPINGLVLYSVYDLANVYICIQLQLLSALPPSCTLMCKAKVN